MMTPNLLATTTLFSNRRATFRVTPKGRTGDGRHRTHIPRPLTAILALDDNAYGVTIHAKVEDLSRPKKATRGAVYATLDRMEDKGLITSWLSEPTKERGGRSRRHYRIEKSGEKALRESARTAQRLFETIAQNLGGLAWKPPR